MAQDANHPEVSDVFEDLLHTGKLELKIRPFTFFI
jgi:hypothetical protein